MRYKLRNTIIDTYRSLTEEQLEALSGEYKGGLQSLMAVYSLKSKQSWLVDYQVYYYAPFFGLVKAKDWKLYLPKEFLECKKTITQICVEYGIPRSFDRFLKTDNSYKEFVTSPSYKHLLGVLNHTKHENYGIIANEKKTDKVRVSDRRASSWKRVEPLLKANNVTLLEPWEGTRLGNKIRYYKVKCNICGTIYESYLHGRDVKCCPSCKEGSWHALRETRVRNLLERNGVKVLQSYRDLIKGKSGYPMEVDLYLPDYKIAFEFNGYRYHTANGDFPKGKYYHKYKTEELLKKGVKLYQIWSDVSDELCESLVLSKVGLLRRIYARNCSFGVSSSLFMEENHVDGDARAKKRWSLYYNNVEVAQISLRECSEGIEIARFASLKGFVVYGGYTKLLKQVVTWAKSEGYTKLITYCNRDLSPDPQDNFYANHGFHFEGMSSLILKYTNYGPVMLNGIQYKSNQVIPRQRCQKHLLLKHLGLSSSPLTEEELAKQIGLYQVFNSGNMKYSLIL